MRERHPERVRERSRAPRQQKKKKKITLDLIHVVEILAIGKDKWRTNLETTDWRCVLYVFLRPQGLTML